MKSYPYHTLVLVDKNNSECLLVRLYDNMCVSIVHTRSLWHVFSWFWWMSHWVIPIYYSLLLHFFSATTHTLIVKRKLLSLTFKWWIVLKFCIHTISIGLWFSKQIYVFPLILLGMKPYLAFSLALFLSCGWDLAARKLPFPCLDFIYGDLASLLLIFLDSAHI